MSWWITNTARSTDAASIFYPRTNTSNVDTSRISPAERFALRSENTLWFSCHVHWHDLALTFPKHIAQFPDAREVSSRRDNGRNHRFVVVEQQNCDTSLMDWTSESSTIQQRSKLLQKRRLVVTNSTEIIFFSTSRQLIMIAKFVVINTEIKRSSRIVFHVIAHSWRQIQLRQSRCPLAYDEIIPLVTGSRLRTSSQSPLRVFLKIRP